MWTFLFQLIQIFSTLHITSPKLIYCYYCHLVCEAVAMEDDIEYRRIRYCLLQSSAGY